MYRIRKVKTASGKTAVQVVAYRRGQTLVIKHLGSAGSSSEMESLIRQGRVFIENDLGIVPLLPELSASSNSERQRQVLAGLRIYRKYHHLAYECFHDWYRRLNFDSLDNPLLRDLSFMRMVEPSSKLRALKLLARYFGRSYSPRSLYRRLEVFPSLKDRVEKMAVVYAQKYLQFDFHLVFYDVTTLYFETFAEDDLRKCGYSKDGKANQPQILVGLLVSREGFPIAYDLYPGQTFEGKTLIPLILSLKRRFHLKRLTVVADAAMMSLDNLRKLKKERLNYIVGARVANLTQKKIRRISRFLKRKEGVYYRSRTDHGLLLCDYSKKRAAKDRADRQKQIRKAQKQMAGPKSEFRRSRFLKVSGQSTYSLNTELIDKDKLLDGIKGYYTNLGLAAAGRSPSLIVARYHDLWQVEKAFRLAKSDLLARPVFHHKEANIKAHLLIVFISLCLSKSLELYTGLSLKRIKDLVWEIEDIIFENEAGQEVATKRMDIKSEELLDLLKKIGLTTY